MGRVSLAYKCLSLCSIPLYQRYLTGLQHPAIVLQLYPHHYSPEPVE